MLAQQYRHRTRKHTHTHTHTHTGYNIIYIIYSWLCSNNYLYSNVFHFNRVAQHCKWLLKWWVLFIHISIFNMGGGGISSRLPQWVTEQEHADSCWMFYEPSWSPSSVRCDIMRGQGH